MCYLWPQNVGKNYKNHKFLIRYKSFECDSLKKIIGVKFVVNIIVSSTTAHLSECLRNEPIYGFGEKLH